MLSGNQESPAAPAEQYDTLATLPAETNKLDAMDLLIRKIGQLRDLCNTCSYERDDSVAGAFWFMADALQCCEQLADRVFKATAAAADRTTPDTTPDVLADQTTPDTSDHLIAIPETRYNDLSLSLETLRAQLLIVSDPEVWQTNIERTLSAFVYGMQCEADRAIAAISDCSRVHPFKHRHGPDMEQTP